MSIRRIFALFCRWLLALGQEVVADTRAVQEQIIPSFTQRNDHPAAADLQNIHLMHILGKGYGLGQAHGLTAVAGEHG